MSLERGELHSFVHIDLEVRGTSWSNPARCVMPLEMPRALGHHVIARCPHQSVEQLRAPAVKRNHRAPVTTWFRYLGLCRIVRIHCRGLAVQSYSVNSKRLERRLFGIEAGPL